MDTPKLKAQHNTYHTSSMDYGITPTSCQRSTMPEGNSAIEEEPKLEDKNTANLEDKSTAKNVENNDLQQSQSQTLS